MISRALDLCRRVYTENPPTRPEWVEIYHLSAQIKQKAEYVLALAEDARSYEEDAAMAAVAIHKLNTEALECISGFMPVPDLPKVRRPPEFMRDLKSKSSQAESYAYDVWKVANWFLRGADGIHFDENKEAQLNDMIAAIEAM